MSDQPFWAKESAKTRYPIKCALKPLYWRGCSNTQRTPLPPPPPYPPLTIVIFYFDPEGVAHVILHHAMSHVNR